MPPRTRALLFDIQHAAIGITRFIEGKTVDDYKADLMLRSACERQFEIIGEAMSRLRSDDPGTVQRISEYQGIIGFQRPDSHLRPSEARHDVEDHWREATHSHP